MMTQHIYEIFSNHRSLKSLERIFRKVYAPCYMKRKLRWFVKLELLIAGGGGAILERRAAPPEEIDYREKDGPSRGEATGATETESAKSSRRRDQSE